MRQNKDMTYLGTICFLAKYIKKHRLNFIMFYWGMFFDTLLSIVMPILFGIMVDEMVYYKNVHIFIRISVVYVIMTLFSCILYFFIYAQHHFLMSMYTFDIRMDVFKHFQKCKPQVLMEIGSGEMLQIIKKYPTECMHFVIRNIIHVFNNLLSSLIILIYVFKISWQVGVFILVAIPITIRLNRYFGSRIRRFSMERRKNTEKYSSWIFEMLSGLQDIRILHAGKKVDLLFNQHNKELFINDVNCKREMLNAQFFIDFMNLVVQLCIYLFTIYLSSKNSITIGLITVILTFYTTLKGKINALSSSFFDAQERISYIQKINEFLHKETEDEGDKKNILQVRKGNISFEHVIYSYDSKKEVLRGVDLEIRPGEKFALVGESGSGKTTIAYLLNRFYIPSGGTIKIDSVELDTCSLKSIRNQVGMVAQDVLLFEGTIRENLLLGDIHASEEKIQQACQKAGIWNFICTLDRGLDTMVGNGGRCLSGGQKQRIAIARIYLKNPPIIIFDEATSALDSETEGLILSEWEQALENRTAVVIAHRYSSVLKCDRCGILKDGVITEIGKPLDLAKSSIQFKTLFAL